jgi:hypothetical protein
MFAVVNKSDTNLNMLKITYSSDSRVPSVKKDA